MSAARHLQQAGAKMLLKQKKVPVSADSLNAKLREAERGLLIPEGLPNRPWFHHSIYAPGQYTGYAAVVIPGVTEAIDRADLDRTEKQIAALAAALNRAAQVLEQYR
jgi:N-acetylated-alpha-linked acidic dipeptidase